MANKINQVKVGDYILKGASITKHGRTFAFEFGADGLSFVDNEISQPNDLKSFVAGNNTITSFAFASNVDKLKPYVLAGYDLVEDVYLSKNYEPVVLNELTFSGLSNLAHIYVPSDLLLQYQSDYADYDYVDKLTALTTDYVITIPFIDNTTLTKAFVDDYIGMLNQGQKSACSKVIIADGYDTIDTDSLSALNELPNADTLEINVETIKEDAFKGVSAIHYVDSKNADLVCEGVLDSTGTLSMKWLVPLNLLYSYIFKEYVKDYYITGYADVMEGNSMPDRIENGYWQWFSAKTTTQAEYLGNTETYPTATYSGRYYAFVVIDTLKISGSGTLTAEIVQNAINSVDTDISPLENITRMVISSNFTQASFDSVMTSSLTTFKQTLTNLNKLFYGTNEAYIFENEYYGLFDNTLYTKYDYIRFTDNAYLVFQSGLGGELPTKVKQICRFNNITTLQRQGGGAGAGFSTIIGVENGNFIASNKNETLLSTPADLNKHEIKLLNNKYYFDNELKKTFTITYNAWRSYLLGCYDNWGGISQFCKFDVFQSLYVTQGRKFNLIPAVRKSDNVVGFYDTFNKVFKTPEQGTFTAGND